jgi:hypothetical protein
MKKGLYLIGTVFITGIIGYISVSELNFSSSESVYQQKDLGSLNAQKSDEAAAWLKARYIDVQTGETISPEKLAQIQKDFSKIDKNKSITFIDQGPDNIGGRTRAICVDRTEPSQNILWAGGVSGGLFYSWNKGNTWTKVEEYANAGASPFISSMTMTKDGTLYVATGSNQESWNGNGVWYSSDKGTTWNSISGTSSVTEVVSGDASDYVWMATPSGLRKWKVGLTAMETIPVAAGGCFALKISKDEQVIVAAFGSNKTYVSEDGGLSFDDKSGSSASNLVPNGASRIEYAISPTLNNDGKYSLYAVRTNSNLVGMNVSHDNGQTWYQFVGASGVDGPLNIFRDQGTYNSIVSVLPNNPEEILIGGIDIWRWTQAVNNPPSGGFEQVSQWFVSPSSDVYVHADNHEMKWDDNDRFYAGNDGGVGVSTDYGQTYFPANRGYNVTQFYGIAFDREGAVMGGAQDNGTLYNDHTLSTYQEFREVGGGDGFECEISFYNPKVMFSSIYYNSISRSGDKGQTWTSFNPILPGTYDPAGTDGSPLHPFHTEFILAEYYDLNSQDSVTFVATKNYPAGSVIRIPSFSSGDSMSYVTPSALYFDDTLYYNSSLTQILGNDTTYYGQNPITLETFTMGDDTVAYNIAWDTLKVQDPYQSWFLVYVNSNGGELWGTRNALRFSVSAVNWVCVARGIGTSGGFQFDMEFSRDLNHLYVTAGNGVWRIDNLGSVYTSDADFKDKVAFVGTGVNATSPTFTTATKISSTGYEGIAVNPNDDDDLLLLAGFSGSSRRSSNASTAGTNGLTSVVMGSVSGVASYDGIIDMTDSDRLVIGTSNGVLVSENGGTTWTNASEGFEGTPVYEVRQSWRTAAEGNGRPGEIYLGTYGRGIWSSSGYLSTPNVNSAQFKSKLLAFPNPTTDNTTLQFQLAKPGNVTVQVYTITGRMVKNTTVKGLEAGDNSIQLNCEDLPLGTYIVKFVSGKQTDNTKFIKM